MLDIYFYPEYGKLYEKIEGGKCEHFEFNNEYGTIYHVYIKREIETQESTQKWYDLTTPYGYGGPVITGCDKGKRDELVQAFMKAFGKHCEENNIISEFVRFHPIIENAKNFKGYYLTEYQRDTVGTTIKTEEDFLYDEFSKSARKSVRKALDSGIEYSIARNPGNIDSFKEIYYSTMNRQHASDYFYFEDDYFEDCLDSFGENILFIEVLYEGKVIAAALYFVYNDIIHAHLSGTLNEYIKLSPAYVIKYATANWAKNNGISTIHYGGGTSNNSDDPLFTFKKKFTKSTFFQFYTGKKIWNNEMYKKICNEKKVSTETDFFPAYREK